MFGLKTKTESNVEAKLMFASTLVLVIDLVLIIV